jgi:class 3 adenylate cyclase
MDECIEADERAYAAYVEAGSGRRAARVALKLVTNYANKLSRSVAEGWLNSAQRLLGDEPECPEHGYLSHTLAAVGWASGNFDSALDYAKRTFEIGSRFGDRDLQALGLNSQGGILVYKGQVAEGLALLDEAMVAAVGGELSAYATGGIYCATIRTCEQLSDYRRAAEWTEAANRWCDRQSITGFPGRCRVNRAQIMRLRGAWAEAEQDARRACDELEHFTPFFAADAFYEVGEIRLRVGDLAAAEDAFRRAHELGREPQPGLSMLRLAEGKVGAAATMIKRALADRSWDRLARARLLPAQVEIAVAAGDQETARPAVEEVEEIARDYDSPALHASASCARGALHLAEGDSTSACESLRRGWRLWQEVDAPYEAARARMTLAAAHQGEGDAEAAMLELRSARSAFERLGAVPDAERAAELLGAAAGLGTGPAEPASRAVKTFMFTDIVKSTNLVEAIGDEAWEDLLHWHDETLRSLFAENGGDEIKQLGEGFFVAFSSPDAGIGCAMEIQRRLAQHRKKAGFSPQIRIGLHASEATRRGEDYGGRGVHVAARVGAKADAGEILCTRDTLRLVDGANYRVLDSRSVNLKGIADPVEVATIDWR